MSIVRVDCGRGFLIWLSEEAEREFNRLLLEEEDGNEDKDEEEDHVADRGRD